MSSGQAGRGETACVRRRRSVLRCRMLCCTLLLLASTPLRARAQEPATAPPAVVQSESARAKDEHGVPAQANDARSEAVRLADARLQGYLESVLERELLIPHEEYS